MKINIGYLIIREEVFSPIVRTQVIDMLKSLNKEKFKPYIIWACRVDYYFKKRNEYELLKSELNSCGIELIRLPIMVLKFPLSESQIKFLSKQLIGKVRNLIKKEDISVLHARGYNAGYIISHVAKKENVNTIFDARSPYITEIQTTYGVEKDSNKFEFWKHTEQFIVENCTKTIAVTKTFKQYLEQYQGDVVHIPNNANVSSETILEKSKDQRRNAICYVGSIGYGWNDVRQYAQLTKKLCEKYKELSFEYYVMPNGIPIVEKEFEDHGIPRERYSICTEKPEKIKDRISGSLCGLQIMSRPDVRMGIKTVDYLSAGIPIICNSNAIGCKEVVEEFEVGICLDLCSEQDLYNFIERQYNNNMEMAERCLKVATDNFSTKAVAQMYEQCYENTIKD
ncbi:glycosyltransferase [Priestia megaterium]|uniref:glycosyltransferase n=1 Tax=Priestia megaterium TaxID=1404 RepID=UPI00398FC507